MTAHLLKDMVGRVYKTKGGTDCTIISYTNSKDLVVRFNDDFGYIKRANLHQLRKGSVRNPFDKTVFGIGFLGVGKYNPTESKKATVAYEHWRSMIIRCYSGDLQAVNPTYKGCSVCEEWYNFQNFAEWFYSQDFNDCGYQLDKDILVEGNKLYSPNTCRLVPKTINCLLHSNVNSRGNYPQGVSPYNNTGMFRAILKEGEVTRALGVYDTQEEAYNSYRVAKEARVKSVALMWKDKIDEKVFDSLMSWTLN